jgi:hypothetical protein
MPPPFDPMQDFFDDRGSRRTGSGLTNMTNVHEMQKQKRAVSELETMPSEADARIGVAHSGIALRVHARIDSMNCGAAGAHTPGRLSESSCRREPAPRIQIESIGG